MWRHVRDRVVAGREYQLQPEHVSITPLPPWIHRDLKAEVLREGNLTNGQSILTDGLAERIAKQFRLHPWVGQVVSVQLRHPSGADVQLVYRAPVALVEIRGRKGDPVPVDAEAIVLPESDFSPTERRNYPLVTGIATEPRVEGAKWGDLRVQGAARIAAAIGDQWQRLRLYSIVPTDPTKPSRTNDDAMFEIYTHGHTRIQWGSPPGSERMGEPPAAEKIARLIDYALENGSLDGQNGPQLINLRETGAIQPRSSDQLGTLPNRDESN